MVNVLVLVVKVFNSAFTKAVHCVKSVRIRSYSGPHFSRIFPHSGKYGKNTDHNNSEYGHFLRSGWYHSSQCVIVERQLLTSVPVTSRAMPASCVCRFNAS